MRCQLKVEADGCFELVTTRPQPYLLPTDGPVGELLRTSHRNAWPENDLEVARRYQLPTNYLAVDLPVRLALAD